MIFGWSRQTDGVVGASMTRQYPRAAAELFGSDATTPVRRAGRTSISSGKLVFSSSRFGGT
jgi:hypothetical protein